MAGRTTYREHEDAVDSSGTVEPEYYPATRSESDKLARFIIITLCKTNGKESLKNFINKNHQPLEFAGIQTTAQLRDFLQQYSHCFILRKQSCDTDDLETVRDHRNVQDDGSMDLNDVAASDCLEVEVTTNLKICELHSQAGGSCDGGRDCNGLHMCRFFILSGKCNFGKNCKFGHWHSSWGNHNHQVLRRHLMDCLNVHDLRMLFRRRGARTSATRPMLCRFYNSTGCSKGNNCIALHVCEHFLFGDCMFKDKCRLSHDFLDPVVQHILQQYGIEVEDLAEIMWDNKLNPPASRRPTTKSRSFTHTPYAARAKHFVVRSQEGRTNRTLSSSWSSCVTREDKAGSPQESKINDSIDTSSVDKKTSMNVDTILENLLNRVQQLHRIQSSPQGPMSDFHSPQKEQVEKENETKVPGLGEKKSADPREDGEILVSEGEITDSSDNDDDSFGTDTGGKKREWRQDRLLGHDTEDEEARKRERVKDEVTVMVDRLRSESSSITALNCCMDSGRGSGFDFRNGALPLADSFDTVLDGARSYDQRQQKVDISDDMDATFHGDLHPGHDGYSDRKGDNSWISRNERERSDDLQHSHSARQISSREPGSDHHGHARVRYYKENRVADDYTSQHSYAPLWYNLADTKLDVDTGKSKDHLPISPTLIPVCTASRNLLEDISPEENQRIRRLEGISPEQSDENPQNSGLEEVSGDDAGGSLWKERRASLLRRIRRSPSRDLERPSSPRSRFDDFERNMQYSRNHHGHSGVDDFYHKSRSREQRSLYQNIERQSQKPSFDGKFGACEFEKGKESSSRIYLSGNNLRHSGSNFRHGSSFSRNPRSGSYTQREGFAGSTENPRRLERSFDRYSDRSHSQGHSHLVHDGVMEGRELRQIPAEGQQSTDMRTHPVRRSPVSERTFDSYNDRKRARGMSDHNSQERNYGPSERITPIEDWDQDNAYRPQREKDYNTRERNIQPYERIIYQEDGDRDETANEGERRKGTSAWNSSFNYSSTANPPYIRQSNREYNDKNQQDSKARSEGGAMGGKPQISCKQFANYEQWSQYQGDKNYFSSSDTGPSHNSPEDVDFSRHSAFSERVEDRHTGLEKKLIRGEQEQRQNDMCNCGFEPKRNCFKCAKTCNNYEEWKSLYGDSMPDRSDRSHSNQRSMEFLHTQEAKDHRPSGDRDHDREYRESREQIFPERVYDKPFEHDSYADGSCSSYQPRNHDADRPTVRRGTTRGRGPGRSYRGRGRFPRKPRNHKQVRSSHQVKDRSQSSHSQRGVIPPTKDHLYGETFHQADEYDQRSQNHDLYENKHREEKEWSEHSGNRYKSNMAKSGERNNPNYEMEDIETLHQSVNELLDQFGYSRSNSPPLTPAGQKREGSPDYRQIHNKGNRSYDQNYGQPSRKRKNHTRKYFPGQERSHKMRKVSPYKLDIPGKVSPYNLDRRRVSPYRRPVHESSTRGEDSGRASDKESNPEDFEAVQVFCDSGNSYHEDYNAESEWDGNKTRQESSPHYTMNETQPCSDALDDEMDRMEENILQNADDDPKWQISNTDLRHRLQHKKIDDNDLRNHLKSKQKLSTEPLQIRVSAGMAAAPQPVKGRHLSKSSDREVTLTVKHAE